MKRYKFPLLILSFIFAACTNPCAVCGEDPCQCPAPDPANTIYYTESDEIIANPERGFLVQVYYESNDINKTASAKSLQNNRESQQITLYLHSYYLTDYMESDISQAFLDRMEANFKALRAGGGKAVLRYSYKHDESNKSKPWDTSLDWMKRHIDQLAPYWKEYTDVILLVQAGFIGVWGEWYYTSNFKMNPSTDADYAPRWELVNHILKNLPEDRQLGLRTPTFKMRYLQMNGGDVTPIAEHEAYTATAKARLCAFNDCFLASANDVGTYSNVSVERPFWAEDSKYTFMGGETCGTCGDRSKGPTAVKEMEEFHWTYINRDYHKDVLNSWFDGGYMNEIKRRLGYRFVLDKAIPSVNPTAGKEYTIILNIRNVGFASLHNPRTVELVFVSKNDPSQKFAYKQPIDPRFWMPGETSTVTLRAKLDKQMAGEYGVYLNLPDAYDVLHDNPAFSIRLANEDIWDEKTGYNHLTDVVLQ